MTIVCTIEEALVHVRFLSHLNKRQLARLAALTVRRSFRPGTTIVRPGDTSMSFYIVLSGALDVLREADNGSSVPVARLGPGDCFGEMGLMEDTERAATVVAREETECALLSRWDFQNALRQDPEIALALLPVLSQRIRELDTRLADQESPARVRN